MEGKQKTMNKRHSFVPRYSYLISYLILLILAQHFSAGDMVGLIGRKEITF